MALVLAFAFRVTGLDTYGFSEDEVAKLQAIDAYRDSQFAANAEHPMLVKLVIWASLTAAGRWNAVAGGTWRVSPEAALRAPNVAAGTATVAVVYGVVALLFTPATAVLAAFIVALDPNVTAINRLGKEDTFALAFFLLGVYFHERAKQRGAYDPKGAQAWYAASGAGFGLMLASKYLLYLFGVNAVFNRAAMPVPGENKPRKLLYYGLAIVAFVMADFAILLPSTWAYCLAYLQGSHSTHHGYLYAGTLYVNAATILMYGIPLTYYPVLLASKVPLPVLAGAALGIVPMVRRRRERGMIWLRVYLVLLLIGYSVVAAKFQRYALPMLLFLDILAAAGLVALCKWMASWTSSSWFAPASSARGVAGTAGGDVGRRWLPITIGATVVWLIAAQTSATPFYSTFQNAIGAAWAPPATIFPEEAYDYGVREAVGAIAEAAGRTATVVSDVPLAVGYYLKRADRQDLVVRSLSKEGLAPAGEQWVLVQDAHRYFENASLIDQLRRSTPWREYRIRGTVVLQVFRVVH